MKEEIISFKTAKLALEKNITFPSTISYTKDGDICNNESLLGKVVKKYPIISQSLLQRILREDYNIHIEILFGKDKSNVWFTLNLYSLTKPKDGDSEDNYNNLYESLIETEETHTYEEALELGLYKTLELI